MTREDELKKLKKQMDLIISTEEMNIGSIYKLKGYLRLFQEPIRVQLDELIDDLDTYLFEGHEVQAYRNVERISGILSAQIAETQLFDEHTGEELGSDLAYFQITEAERNDISLLASEMRKIVNTSTQFDQPHKVRLLKRISAIEQEVFKEKGLFDVILGGISDVGVTAGQFGDDVKPLVKRMAEIEQITRGKSPDYAKIEKPEEIKRIENKSGEGDGE